jgi:hypothetical protein
MVGVRERFVDVVKDELVTVGGGPKRRKDETDPIS